MQQCWQYCDKTYIFEFKNIYKTKAVCNLRIQKVLAVVHYPNTLSLSHREYTTLWICYVSDKRQVRTWNVSVRWTYKRHHSVGMRSATDSHDLWFTLHFETLQHLCPNPWAFHPLPVPRRDNLSVLLNVGRGSVEELRSSVCQVCERRQQVRKLTSHGNFKTPIK